MKDTKFTVAIHILVMLATSKEPLNSEDLANSVGTNASYIRKVMALLKEHQLIASQRGKSGTELLVAPHQVSLLDLYRVIEGEDPHIFQFHQNPNPTCPIGRNIKQAVFPFLEDAETQLQKSLQADTLADIITRIQKLERHR